MSHQSTGEQQSSPAVSDQLNGVIIQFLSGQTSGTMQDFSLPIIKPGLVHIYPIFISLYAVLAVLSVGVNLILIIFVIYHKLYLDCTHAFLANLSVAYLLQSIVVLPITLVVIIFQNWIYGEFMCFFLPILQVSQIGSFPFKVHIPFGVGLLSRLVLRSTIDSFGEYFGGNISFHLRLCIFCCY